MKITLGGILLLTAAVAQYAHAQAIISNSGCECSGLTGCGYGENNYEWCYVPPSCPSAKSGFGGEWDYCSSSEDAAVKGTDGCKTLWIRDGTCDQQCDVTGTGDNERDGGDCDEGDSEFVFDWAEIGMLLDKASDIGVKALDFWYKKACKHAQDPKKLPLQIQRCAVALLCVDFQPNTETQDILQATATECPVLDNPYALHGLDDKAAECLQDNEACPLLDDRDLGLRQCCGLDNFPIPIEQLANSAQRFDEFCTKCDEDKPDIGLIVGCVIGGVVALVIIGAIVYYCMRRQKSEKIAPAKWVQPGVQPAVVPPPQVAHTGQPQGQAIIINVGK
eukprot:GDKI01042815.1.p1 GENE.GDKI01042815.1~~GDKI01042815.1.p1  ORF type:complete len:334 (+),score=59.22 GDKI01042815.1:168-1169(+)